MAAAEIIITRPIICLSGQAGVGKNAIADILQQKYHYVILGLADAIKRIVQQAYDFSDDQLFGASENRNIIDPRYGFCPRDTIKVFGTAGRQLYGLTWIEKTILTISTLDRLYNEGQSVYYEAKRGIYFPQTWQLIEGFCVADLRYQNEMDAFRELGARIVRVKRPGAGLKGEAGEHSSEKDQLSIPDSYFDYIFENDEEGLINLEEKVDRLME